MNERVLIVDDEEAIVEGLCELLEMEQIEASGAFDRLSAEALMEQTFFAVIVADLRLHTEAEGLELLDAIRRISPRSRVITLTGYSTPTMVREVLGRGSSMVISKPSTGSVMLAAIADLLAEVEALAATQKPLDLEQLHASLRTLLHSIPRKRYGLSADEAEDVVQQAWLLFLEKRDLIRAPRPWLIGTVANLSKRQIGLLVQRRETFVGDALTELPDPRVKPADGDIALGQALAVLDNQSRTICNLIAVGGYAYDEVSALMGLPLGSIGPMYGRAKTKMRLRIAA
jgi:DNA-binding NarL/FixJ family response regulator